MESDDDRQKKAGIAELATNIGISLATAAAIFGASLAWDLDRTVLTHDTQLKYMLERQDDLRQQLRCDPIEDPHPLCARIERLDGLLNESDHQEHPVSEWLSTNDHR